MSIPPLPGMSAYPDLERKYRTAYRKASADRKCPDCETGKVVRRFMDLLSRRQVRDKHR